MNRYIICILLPALLLFSSNREIGIKKKTAVFLEGSVMRNAAWAMEQEPETITTFPCERSDGGIHDFYSEGDYWWPDPNNPEGPYIRRDGEPNPGNFVSHRLSMKRFSKIVGYLASAYLLTHDESYVAHAFKHINAWFVDTSTLMNPSLLYAQAIKGVVSGRGIGIIDTIHLMEVAQGIFRMQNALCIQKEELEKVKSWFNSYVEWLTTHPYGMDEMNAKNNHGTCWVMQVASFAKLTGNKEILDFCSDKYKKILLPGQMAENGSFPQELDRTKPYHYSIFNLDAMVMVCLILSTEENNLWDYSTETGLNIKKGIDFLFPYLEDKSKWPYGKDVMNWEERAVVSPALIFSAVYYENHTYFHVWKVLGDKIINGEVESNCPIRNPFIWM